MQFVEGENVDDFREEALYKAIERIGYLIEEGFKPLRYCRFGSHE